MQHRASLAQLAALVALSAQPIAAHPLGPPSLEDPPPQPLALPISADLDGDGQLTVLDFRAFRNLFESKDPRADFERDGQFNIRDFSAFQNAAAVLADQQAGWTVLAPSVDSRLIYVDPAGDDRRDGGPFSPVKTAAAAYALARDGYPDWIHFRAGANFEQVNLYWDKSGRSPTERMVITSYGQGDRPRLRSGSGTVITSARANLAVVGLHLSPGAGVLVDDTVGITPCGIVMVTGEPPCGEVLLEDLLVEGFFKGIVVDHFQGARPFNIRMNRCIVADCYNQGPAHTAGAYFGGVDGLRITESTFDHNGWREDIPRAVPNIFRRNLYVQSNCTGVELRGNIFARSSAEGAQVRSGGIVEDNLFLRNGVSGLYIAGRGHARRNVVLDSRNLDEMTPRGFGIDGKDLTEGSIEGNLCAYRTTEGDFGIIGISTPWKDAELVIVARNVVYDWQWLGAGAAYALFSPVRFNSNAAYAPLGGSVLLTPSLAPWPADLASGNSYGAQDGQPVWVENGGRLVDLAAWKAAAGEQGSKLDARPPANPPTIGTYAAGVGAGSSLESFLAAARAQRRGSWRAELAAPAVNEAMRAGFEVRP